VFALIIGGLLAGIAIWLLRPQRLQTDPVLKIYRTFCHKLARRGLIRRENETAGDFARRVKQQRPELARRVDNITALYAHLRYAGNGSDKQLLQFKQSVVQFKP